MKANYEAPQIEVIEIEIEGAVLIESTTPGSDWGNRLLDIF